MAWRDLLETGGSTAVLPWVGGRSLCLGTRAWYIDGVLPREHSWAKFALSGRKAKLQEVCYPETSILLHRVLGYLVGDRLVSRDARVDPDPAAIAFHSERVHLIERGVDRFALISAGRACTDGPLVFVQQEMPLGPEPEVHAAFLDGKPSVDDVPGVAPALDAAFRMARWQREMADRRRHELEAALRREEEARQLATRRQEIMARLGDGAGRREMAGHDFEAAARAALAVGGASYLEHRVSCHDGEIIVRFRLEGRRFECTCDRRTLQIIDSGICLTAHEEGEFARGTRGDGFFTLESLPSVIRQADEEGKLVVFRHVD